MKRWKFPTSIMIAGGDANDNGNIYKNSPKPKESTNIFANDLVIELQDEFVTDEIHVHDGISVIALDASRKI